MGKKLLVALVTLFLFGISIGQNAEFYPNKIVVKFNLSSSKSVIEQTYLSQIEVQTGCKVLNMRPLFKGHLEFNQKSNNQHPLSNIYELELSHGNNLWSVIGLLNKMPNVKYAEPLFKIEVFDTPNDPQIGYQYYLPLIKATEAFDITHGDTNILIGIVDTGVDYYHEDLKTNFKYNYNDTINGIDDDYDGFVDNYRGWDFGDNDNNAQSEYNHHGTLVCGMASAATNNNIGIAGIGFNSKILPIKVMDLEGDMGTAYEGIVYAADHSCQIINCSWGGTSYSKLGADVIDYVVNEKNCLVVAAAGNSRTDVSYYPASYTGVLSVAATDWADLKWNGSSYSINVDICAPGNSVRTTAQNNGYSSVSGTSFASPLVAGVAALVKAYRPELNAYQLAEQLRITSDIIDTIPDNQYFYHKMGYGRVNALRALTINSLPSIRILNVDFSTNQSASLLNGDTLMVTFNAINYLAGVTNCVIKLTSNSAYVTPIQNIINTDVLGTMQQTNNIGQPMLFKINDVIPENFSVQFTFEMVATIGMESSTNYHDYQSFNCTLNKTFLNVSPNLITTTLTSNGKIGFENRIKSIGNGFIYDHHQNFLNDGGIIIATDKDHMASSFFSGTEFQTSEIIDTFSIGDSLFIGISAYKAIESTQLPITIKQKTIAYKSGIFESSIIHEYSITNQATIDFSNLSMSLFADWDVDNPSANEIAFNPELNLYYTFNHSSHILYSGICLLTLGKTLPYGFDLVSGGNGGIDITEGFSNGEKWFTMTNSRPMAGNSGDTINIATLLTAGPYNLVTNDSIQIAWALIAAKNQYELKEIARKLQEKYIETRINKEEKENKWFVYPNPSKETLFIENRGASGEIEVQLYNAFGKLCKSTTSKEESVKLITYDLTPGIYLIQIKNNHNVMQIEKIIITQ